MRGTWDARVAVDSMNTDERSVSHGKVDVAAVLRADPRALGRALTVVAANDDAAQRLLEDLRPRLGKAFRVAVTGPGGVGKSSLLREICRGLRRRGDRVAVVAADPSSVVSRGAMLGDRVRFAELLEDPDTFIRSLAHRGQPGTPAPGAVASADVLDAAGFPWVFFETVGTGQMEVGALSRADLKVLVLSPQCGDDIQMLKAGLTEVADLIVVTGADQSGARTWARRLESVLGVEATAENDPGRVFCVSSANGEGVGDLVDEVVRRAAARGT